MSTSGPVVIPRETKFGEQLRAERDQGDQGDDTELIAGAEDALDVEEMQRSVHQEPTVDFQHQRQRKPKSDSQNVADSP